MLKIFYFIEFFAVFMTVLQTKYLQVRAKEKAARLPKSKPLVVFLLVFQENFKPIIHLCCYSSISMGAFTYLNGVGTIQDFIRAVGFSSVIFFILKFYSLLDYDVNFPDDDFRGKSIKPINGPGHGKMVEPFIKKKNEKVL